MPTGRPQSTIYGPAPTEDLQMANKRYVDDSGGSVPTIQEALKSGDSSTSSSTMQDIEDLTFTLPNNTGSSMITLTVCHANSQANRTNRFTIDLDDVLQQVVEYTTIEAADFIISTLTFVAPNDGQVVNGLMSVGGGGTVTVYGSANRISSMVALNIN